MYFKEGTRYDQYKSRFDVYLFTLRDYCEQLNLDYRGTYIERSDMMIHTGYLIKFEDADRAKRFIADQAISSSKSGQFTSYVLPHTNGNELPVYATVSDYANVVYIGLSAYPEALEEYAVTMRQVTFDANTGTGTMSAVDIAEGALYTIPASTFTAPSQKKFKNWNSAADGTGVTYSVNDIVTIEGNLALYAIWEDAE